MSTENRTVVADRSTVITTGLNSLADGGYTAPGSELNNASNLDTKARAELAVTFAGGAPTDYSVCKLYMLPALDGSTYPDGDASKRPSEEYYAGSFQLRAVTTAQVVQTGEFNLVGCKTKFVLKNESGVAFPASGSTVKVYTYNRQI